VGAVVAVVVAVVLDVDFGVDLGVTSLIGGIVFSPGGANAHTSPALAPTITITAIAAVASSRRPRGGR